MRPRKGRDLTDKQEAFVREYCSNGWNATKAVIAAGYTAKNIGTAQSIGTENLSKPVIDLAISKKKAELAKKCEVTQEMIVAEMVKVGMANVQDYMDTNNAVRDISELPKDVAAAVESIQVDVRYDGGDSTGYTEKVRLKLHSKLTALDQLARHLGLFEKDNRQRQGQGQTLLQILLAVDGQTKGVLPCQEQAKSLPAAAISAEEDAT
jgi:phage terminase small subunit